MVGLVGGNDGCHVRNPYSSLGFDSIDKTARGISRRIVMYRPPEFENPYLYFGSPHTEFDVINNWKHKAFEAGADAMLEGLRVNRISVLSYIWVADAVEWADRKGGMLVFIPSD